MDANHVRRAAFVARCSGAASLAWALALAFGLSEPVWASISSLVVSQERLGETRSSLLGRVVGTALGIAISVMVNEAASRLHVSVGGQVAVAVALCAVVTRDFPQIRVAMWTCPIVFLGASSSVSIVTTAVHRGSEVILGAVVGWVLHWVAELVVGALTARQPQDNSG